MTKATCTDGSCLLCGGAPAGTSFPYETEWNGRRFAFLACGTCGATFIDPVPSDADFAKLYARSAYHAEYYDAVEEPADTALAELRGQLPASGSLLDFGCGNGAFLRAALDAGFQAFGVELDPEAITDAARNSGCDVFAFDDVKRSGRTFEIIHLGDVLEHLPRPAATMRELEALLAPGGLFFVEGPLEDNASLVFAAARATGWLKRRLRGRSRNDFPPFHLVRVGARAQRYFFETVLGLEIRHFAVSETGWPYANSGASLASPGSAGNFLRLLIGRTSIALGRVLRATPLAYGNRFAALVSPARRA